MSRNASILVGGQIYSKFVEHPAWLHATYFKQEKDVLMNYEARLLEAKENYPFENWQTYKTDGLEQYTQENCEAAKHIFDTLLFDLAALGEDAREKFKIQKFQAAVESLNALNDEADGILIETDEREELCALFNLIAVKAGIDPGNYGDGEGPASEWRDW